MNQRLNVRTAVAISVLASLAIGRTLVAQRRSHEIMLDEPRLVREVGAHWAEAAGRADVAAVLGALVRGAADDTRVSTAADDFVLGLRADPKIAAAMDDIEQMIEHDHVISGLTRGERDTRTEATTHSEAYARAWGRAWNEMLDDHAIAGAFAHLDDLASRNEVLSGAIRDAAERLDDEEVGSRLIAANDGDVPDRERATDLVRDRLYAVDRLAHFYVASAGLPATRRHLASAFHDLLVSPRLHDIVVEEAALVLNDSDVRAAFVGWQRVIVSGPLDEETLYHACSRLLSIPSVRAAISRALERAIADPELARIGTRFATDFTQEPSVRRLIDELLQDWR